MFHEAPADHLLLHGQQTGRPGVRHVGEQLDAGVAEAGNAGDRLLDGHVEIGVGTEGEPEHGMVARPVWPEDWERDDRSRGV